MRAMDVMMKDVILAEPNQTIQEVADLMRQHNIGLIPVTKEDKIVGMVTDRDICIKAVSKGVDITQEKVVNCMTEKVLYCYDHTDLEDVAQDMAQQGIHRMPVMNDDKRLVGIISLSDIAYHEPNYSMVGKTLSRLCQHTQATA